MRLFSAFAILPFVAAALAYVGFPLFEMSARHQLGGIPSAANDSAIAFAAGTFVVATIVTVLGAVPAVSMMSGREPITLKQSLIGGVALGNAPFLIVAALIVIVHIFAGTPKDLGNSWYGASGAIRTITMSTLMGAALGSVFWAMGIRRART